MEYPSYFEFAQRSHRPERHASTGQNSSVRGLGRHAAAFRQMRWSSTERKLPVRVIVSRIALPERLLMSLATTLAALTTLIVRQRAELVELFGFETRNKYAIETETGQAVAFAAEQQKGLLGFLVRQFLGHWRSFELHFFDAERRPILRAVHPFRWLFQRLEVFDDTGQKLGALQQRFALVSKRFDVEDANGRLLMSVNSPFWRIWTFVFERNGRELARIEKKWSGLFAEGFTDKDRFRLQFKPECQPDERQLLLAAAIFVDLRYFERKAS